MFMQNVITHTFPDGCHSFFGSNWVRLDVPNLNEFDFLLPNIRQDRVHNGCTKGQNI